MNLRLPFLLFLSIGCVLVCGCEKKSDLASQPSAAELGKMKSDYDLAIQSAIRDWPIPRSFNHLFSNSINGISYYSGGAGDSRWSSVAAINNHYVLRVVVPIEMDASRTKIISMGSPEAFRLAELANPKTNENGSRTYEVNVITNLSTNDWQLLVKSNGDFNAIGIKLETNLPPVDGFEQAWSKL